MLRHILPNLFRVPNFVVTKLFDAALLFPEAREGRSGDAPDPGGHRRLRGRPDNKELRCFEAIPVNSLEFRSICT